MISFLLGLVGFYDSFFGGKLMIPYEEIISIILFMRELMILFGGDIICSFLGGFHVLFFGAIL